MQTTQTTLTDDESPTEEATDRTTTGRTTTNASQNLAPPEQRGGQGCCPWCLASAETFEYHDDGSVGCGHCDAAIPVGTPWFERGEKIVL